MTGDRAMASITVCKTQQIVEDSGAVVNSGKATTQGKTTTQGTMRGTLGSTHGQRQMNGVSGTVSRSVRKMLESVGDGGILVDSAGEVTQRRMHGSHRRRRRKGMTWESMEDSGAAVDGGKDSAEGKWVWRTASIRRVGKAR